MNETTKLEAEDGGRVASNAGLDVVAKIRVASAWNYGPYRPCNDKDFVRSSLPFEAAEEIEFLRTENAALRKKLEQFNV